MFVSENLLNFVERDRSIDRRIELLPDVASQLVQLRTNRLLLRRLYSLLILPRPAPTTLLLLAVIARSYLHCGCCLA